MYNNNSEGVRDLKREKINYKGKHEAKVEFSKGCLEYGGRGGGGIKLKTFVGDIDIFFMEQLMTLPFILL